MFFITVHIILIIIDDALLYILIFLKILKKKKKNRIQASQNERTCFSFQLHKSTHLSKK